MDFIKKSEEESYCKPCKSCKFWNPIVDTNKGRCLRIKTTVKTIWGIGRKLETNETDYCSKHESKFVKKKAS